MKKEKFFAVRQLAGQKKERVLAEGYRVERGELVCISAALVALGA